MSRYDGREEWIVIDQYREELKALRVDFNNEYLLVTIEAYAFSIETPIMKFLEQATHSTFSDPTGELIKTIRGGV